MVTDFRRLSILTVQEIDDLFGLPRFMEEERHLYFDMSPAEKSDWRNRRMICRPR